MDEKIDDIEVEINQNIISNGKKIKKRNQVTNSNNFNVLTKEQFELMKKIRDETISRTERYSEMVSGNKSNDGLIIPEGPKKKKKIKSETSQKNQSNSDTNTNIGINNQSLGKAEIPQKEKEEININKDRIFKVSQPFLFYKGEPLFIIGPDTQYYVWIFSLVSFLCIIIYGLKSPHIIFKILLIISYLFFGTTYTLLLFLNPGIPTNKNNLDPSILQNGYKQCSECNCIFIETEGKYTIHCERCNICVDSFDHHCTFATKCIGKKNKIIFKLWLYSIPVLFLMSFFYLIF